MNFFFNCELNFVASIRKRFKPGWLQTRIECSTRLGWNIFRRTRHWDKEYKELLPPVTTWHFREVQYYDDKKERIWNFIEKREEFYWAFDSTVKKVRGERTRMVEVVYRLPLVTITNTYATQYGANRDKEFFNELNAEIEQKDKTLQRINNGTYTNKDL